MTRKTIWILLAALVLAGSAAALVSASGIAPARQTFHAANPVIVELFTSQGCSSCPPADELLSVLRSEQSGDDAVIPLAYHVDYWNYLGWSDPFSSSQWSQRQKAYAQTLRGEVYTPQVIINGRGQLVGSSEGEVRREIEKAGNVKLRGSVSVEGVSIAKGKLVVSLRANVDRAAGAGRPQLVVALFEDGVTTKVTRGENRGRALVNDSIVRWQAPAFLLPADGGSETGSIAIPLDADWRRSHLGVAAFIQDQQSLTIYAAAATRLSTTSAGLRGNAHVVLRP